MPAQPATELPPRSSLDRCGCGARVIVSGIEGDDALARRLTSLGFWPGASVEIVRRAPFGDPTQYRLHGYRIALRRAEAARVEVQVEHAGAAVTAAPCLEPPTASSVA